MENAIEIFSESLFVLLASRTSRPKGLLIKKHTDNLQTYGDFSFPISSKSWIEHIEKLGDEENSLLQIIGKSHDDILAESKKWKLQVKKVTEVKGRIYLFLERPGAIPIFLAAGLNNAAFITERLHGQCNIVKIDPLCEKSNCLTYLRVQYLTKVIQNLCSIMLNNAEKLPDIYVTSKSSSTCAGFKILCSTVVSAKTSKKEDAINADEYIRSRQEDMMQIAQHKYGVRVSTVPKWREFIAHLGESAAAFELLQIKPSSAVKINGDNVAGGISKGAAFILYNCARLETMMRTYEEKVQEGVYPPLPGFNDVDFSLLTQEDEWTLIFNYIAGLPSMLESCVEIRGDRCEVRPHLVCGFLCGLVRVFSQYYRKTRVLVQPRQHLLPAVFARMHLLRILNDTLKACLKILNIKSVSQM